MNLKEKRFFKGFNQYDISLKTGIPQSKISLIERGYVNPKPDEKQKIAEALGCRVSEVFAENEAVPDES